MEKVVDFGVKDEYGALAFSLIASVNRTDTRVFSLGRDVGGAMARWQNGDVPDCNPGYAGSNPVRASKFNAAVAQWESVCLPSKRSRVQSPLAAPDFMGATQS